MITSGTAHLDVIVGELVLLDGRRQSDAAHITLLTPPRRAHADRRRETLLIFLDLGGGGAVGLAQAMLDQFKRTFWRCSGPVTTALRQAISAANAHLREENRLMAVSHRRRAGLVCAVLRDDHVYLAQVGPAKALLMQSQQVARFPKERQERLPLGVSTGLDIQFSRGLLRAGDRLLLTGASWAAQLEDSVLADALSAEGAGAEEVMLALERQAGANPFSAIVLECALPEALPAPAPQVSRPSAPPVVAPRSPELTRSEAPAPAGEPRPASRPAFEPDVSAASSQLYPSPPVYEGAAEAGIPAEPEAEWRPTRPLAGFSLGRERLDRSRQGLRRVGVMLADSAQALLTRILPEPEPTPPGRRRRARRSGAESVPMMAGIAIAIPLVVAFVVATFYLQRSAADERDALEKQALRAVEAARQAQGDDAYARWEAALRAAQEALALVPDDDGMLALRAEARARLDALDSAVRPELFPLWFYGAGQGRRLAASRMQVYVLDAEHDQVTRHELDQSRQSVTDDQSILVAYRGQNVGDEEMGPLRDIVWLSAGGAWTSDALLILTEDNRLLQHSLSWGLSWMPFDMEAAGGNVRALRPYDGKIYTLDPEQSQVWRFHFTGDGFGERESYFRAPPPDLSNAVDMAIDGAVYILLADGQILKFFGGEAQPYELSGLPQALVRPVALISEGDTTSGALYVADAGTQSIIAFTKNGEFVHQIKVDGDALADLEALAIEPDSRTLYVIASGHLSALALPSLPGFSGAPAD